MGNHGKRDADPDPTVCVRRLESLLSTVCWECATIAILAFQRRNLAVLKERRSMPTGDNELFSLRRWQVFSELPFLTRLVAQLVLSKTMIQVLLRWIKGTLKVSEDPERERERFKLREDETTRTSVFLFLRVWKGGCGSFPG